MPSSLYGSDVIVELLRRLDIKYAAFNPGGDVPGDSRFAGEFPRRNGDGELCSGGSSSAFHEEISVALAHGYAKAAGEAHGRLSARHRGPSARKHGHLQRLVRPCAPSCCSAAADRWTSRVGGLGSTGSTTALVQGSLVRDYVKWDDQPANLASVPESLLRAYRVMLTDPPGPCLRLLRCGYCRRMPSTPSPSFPTPIDTLPPPAPVAGGGTGWRNWRSGWCSPIFPFSWPSFWVVSRNRYPPSPRLAEVLGAPVLDHGSRFNFPSNHPMDFHGCRREGPPQSRFRPRARYPGSVPRTWTTQDKATRGKRLPAPGGMPNCAHLHLRFVDTRLVHRLSTSSAGRFSAWGGSAARAVTPLVRMVREKLEKNAARREGREGSVRQRSRPRGWRSAVDGVNAAREAWTETPIALPRLAGELWRFLKEEDWVLTNGTLFGWERRMWDFNAAHRIIGHSGGAGLGYGMGASIGAALAHRGSDRLCVNLQADGDLPLHAFRPLDGRPP